jgi:hypothetical protein
MVCGRTRLIGCSRNQSGGDRDHPGASTSIELDSRMTMSTSSPARSRPAGSPQPIGPDAGVVGAVRRCGGPSPSRAVRAGVTAWRSFCGRERSPTWPSRRRRRRGAAGSAGPRLDVADARQLRQLFVGGRVPKSWIPPARVLDARVLVRLYKDLVDERSGWLQRVHAMLFHHGVPAGTPGCAASPTRTGASSATT